MQKEITQTWFFRQPLQEVWDYLTKPELIEQWLMKNDFKPIVGRKFTFTFIPKDGSKYDGVVDCEVLEVEPFTLLSYSWKGYTKDRKRTFKSKVVWSLASKDNGTELQLRHHGFTILEDLLTHTGGWRTCLTRLEKLINTVQI